MLVPESTIRIKEKYITYVVGLLCGIMLLRSGFAGLNLDPSTCLYAVILFSYAHLDLSEELLTKFVLILLALHIILFASPFSQMTETTAILVFYILATLAVSKLRI